MQNLMIIHNNTKTEKFAGLVKNDCSFTVTGLTAFLKLLMLLQLLKKRKAVFVTANEQTAIKYQNDLKKISNIQATLFPYQESSFYDEVELNKYRYYEQIDILTNLQNKNIIFVPVKALLEKFPTTDFISKNSVTITVNSEIDINLLQHQLNILGYKRTTMVTDIGEYSIRGDIIDVYSFEKYPARIELWGDTVTDIRFFNNETQKSFKKVSSVTIKPLYKFILNEESKKNFLREYSDYPDYTEKLQNSGYFDGINYFQSVLNDELINLIDILPNEYVLIFDESSEIFAKYEICADTAKKQLSENIKNGITLPLKTFNHYEPDEFMNKIASRKKIFFDNFIDSSTELIIEFDSGLPQNFASKMEDVAEYITNKVKTGYKIIIATDYKKRTEEILSCFEIPYEEENFSNKNIVTIIENLSSGGTVSHDLKLIVLTDKELFNKKSKDISSHKYQYYKEKQDYIESINDIRENEYVVHSSHGIGIYRGLSKQEIDGQQKDYLTIEYAGGDKLHIPAEQINLLFRYRGSGSQKPTLSRMGGSDWSNTKKKVKKAVEDIARDLLILYAGRKMAEGYAFEPDTVWQYEMEDAFEYTETPDQIKSINEVKSDMEDKKPMDRLLCGDVGFGKTEVALRAVFKAVMSGKQAAVVAPTTILTLQHYQTFCERFKPFPIKIELLSRFRTPKEQKETVARIKSGETDVVIATHRLLQKDIEFKNLGLLVIDEEHKFGVKDKEKLKVLKKNIDILSMSATPIPRTLYMSLSGIRDMSIIATPPVNRLPIKTFVGNYTENSVKNAINHELQRDGQVYFLYNRVESIYDFASSISRIVPNARIAVAHGQMDKTVLEKIILDFSQKEYDILVCTTIIESGLDIPNANTILIYNADKFGLAQLYQLRGRVGRSEKQAYCYCFYANNKELTQEARERLKAIKDFTTLGSGYQIALRDIEIRGIGNILGTKQHGHMVNVGFDTYCQLLEDTISELQGNTNENKEPAIIDINVTAYISDDWVGSKEQKMVEYKRLADVKTIDEAETITAEWKDRFSKIPKPAENLINLVKLRILATNASIKLVRESGGILRIYTPFSQKEWQLLGANLPRNITKLIKFQLAPKACLDGNSILLTNISCLNPEEMFNMLSDLFYYIIRNTNKLINQFYEEK